MYKTHQDKGLLEQCIQNFNKNSIQLHNLFNKDHLIYNDDKDKLNLKVKLKTTKKKRHLTSHNSSMSKSFYNDSLKTFIDSNLTLGGPLQQDPRAYNQILQRNMQNRADQTSFSVSGQKIKSKRKNMDEFKRETKEYFKNS